MEDKPEHFREYLKAASGELKDDLGRHLSEQEMIDYCAGRMDAGAWRQAQSHLARCGACVSVYRDVRDFFEPARAGESAAEHTEVQSEWKRLQKRLSPDEPERARVLRFPQPFWRPAMALAAMLAVALALTALWS